MEMPDSSPAHVASATPPPDPLDLIAAKSMKGDVRDFLLHRLQNDHSALPWNMRGEQSQREVIEAADKAAEDLIRRCATMIMSHGKVIVEATLKQAKLKDVIACELHIDKTHGQRHLLLDSVGDKVMIILADTEEFQGDRGKPKASPDQAALFGDDPGDDDRPLFDDTPNGGDQ